MKNTKNIVVTLLVLIVMGFVIYNSWRQSQGTMILQVPFTSQAPYNNWENNEDCEETSIVMANAYLSDNTANTISAAEASEAIENIKKWEQENLGYNKDTGADATQRVAEVVYGLKVKQIVDFTEQDLKDELDKGHPILLPVNTKLLDTPKYRDVPAFYHMIVIRGYNENEKGFIVNDPGTEDGNGNAYSFETLKSAATDWNHDLMKMEPDRKIALVIFK